MISLLGILLILVIYTPTSIIASIPVPQKAGEYNAEFFEEHRKNNAIYPLLVQLLGQFMIEHDGTTNNMDTVSVLDVGCGHGLLVEAWRDAGITNSYCIEGSPEASPMWPHQYNEEFYIVQDLEADEAPSVVKATDFVTSFEVGEHLQPEKAHHFVGLLTMHHPKLIFFGAATVFQDQGKNPSHVNENTFQYWIEHFASYGYHVDWTKTARVKHMMVMPSDPQAQQIIMKSWWYPKNILIFAPKEVREGSDQALLDHPKMANMLNPAYLNMFGGDDNAFGKMWKVDWQTFGTLFYEAQTNLQGSLTTEL